MPRHIAQKDMASAGDGFDPLGVLGILAQFCAQVRDAHVHRAIKAFGFGLVFGKVHGLYLSEASPHCEYDPLFLWGEGD